MARALQTKNELANSLKDLMKKTSFRKITIQNVTDHCGLNRQTFYYHYKDMNDLLSWIYQNELFREIDTNRDWKNFLITAVEYAQKNRTFVRNTIRSLRKETVERFLSPSVSQWVALLFDDACSGISVRQEDRSFLTGFFTSAFLSSIIHWIGSGMPDDENYFLQRATVVRDMVRFYEQGKTVSEPEAAPFPLLQKLCLE